MKRTIFLLLVFAITGNTFSQANVNPDSIRGKMQWFADAKLGIFIHWGIYAVNGIDESWSFHNKKISHTDYMKQLNGFTASRYNPDEWAAFVAGDEKRRGKLTGFFVGQVMNASKGKADGKAVTAALRSRATGQS